MLAALDSGRHEGERQERLARARRAEDQEAGAALDAAAEQGVELGRSACQQMREKRILCSAEMRRGKARTPPVAIAKSWKPPR
jgi:hypothetical protein